MLYYEDKIFKKHKYIVNLEVFYEGEIVYKSKSYVTDEDWCRNANKSCFGEYEYTETFIDLVLSDEEMLRLEEVNLYGKLEGDCLCEVIDYIRKNEFPEGNDHKLRNFQLEKEVLELKSVIQFLKTKDTKKDAE